MKYMFPNLVKHFPLELKSITRPDMLQSIQDLLALRILLVPELGGRRKISSFSKLRFSTWLVGKARTASLSEN